MSDACPSSLDNERTADSRIAESSQLLSIRGGSGAGTNATPPGMLTSCPGKPSANSSGTIELELYADFSNVVAPHWKNPNLAQPHNATPRQANPRRVPRPGRAHARRKALNPPAGSRGAAGSGARRRAPRP